MKNCLWLLLVTLFVVTSCSNSKVVDNHWIQKRKYRSGFHLDGLSHKRHVEHLKTLPQEERTIEDVARNEEHPNKSEVGTARPNPVLKSTGKSYLEVSAGSDDDNEPKTVLDEQTRADREPVEITEAGEPGLLKKIGNKINGPLGPDPTLPGILSVCFGGANLILFMWVPIVGIILGILAIIFGIKAIRTGDETAAMLGTLGIVFGAISLFIALIWNIYVLFILLIFSL